MTETMEQAIYVPERRLEGKWCDKIIEEFEYRLENFPSTSVIWNSGDDFGPVERKDKATFLDSLYSYDVGMDLRNSMGCGKLGLEINTLLDHGLKEYMEIFDNLKNMRFVSIQQKVQRTPKNGGYHIWHCEQGSPDTASRVLVWSVYLNDVEEGGETEFLYQGKRVKAEKGKLVIFPANYLYTHRGNPPISNTKYIVTGWYNIF